MREAIRPLAKTVHVVPSPLAVHDDIGRLTTIEACRDLAVLFLTLVTTSGRFTLARGWTTTAADALVVRRGIIGERGENGGVAGLLECRGQKGQRRCLGEWSCNELRQLRRQRHQSGWHGDGVPG